MDITWTDSLLLSHILTSYYAIATGAEKEKLKSLITSAEDWLYGDGFDSTKQQYGKYIRGTLTMTLPVSSRNLLRIWSGRIRCSVVSCDEIKCHIWCPLMWCDVVCVTHSPFFSSSSDLSTAGTGHICVRHTGSYTHQIKSCHIKSHHIKYIYILLISFLSFLSIHPSILHYHTSYHIISHDVISYDNILYHVLSLYYVLYHVVLYHVLYQIIPYHLIL